MQEENAAKMPEQTETPLDEKSLEEASGGVKYKEPQPRIYEKTGG